MNASRIYWPGLSVFLLVILLLSASGSNNQVNAATTMKAAPMPPDVLPEAERTLNDTDASLKAKEKRTVTGDDFYKGLYERPFTSNEMAYLEDVDIRVVTFAKDDIYYYFTIELHGVDPEARKLTATYGIEFDRTKTGRGDLLVWAADIKKEWSMDGVKVFSDPDNTVGGPTPFWADKEYDKMGYEKEERLEGERVAYARIDPKDETIVQFAISKALLDLPKEFLWGAWADKGWRDPMRFDYNDHILEPDAGSPIKTSKYYPLKQLTSVDNTCRLTEGFTTTLAIRGKCDEKVCKAVTTCTRIGTSGPPVCTKKIICK